MNKYEETAAWIIDGVLNMVHEQHPEIEQVEESSLLYGESYYTLEQKIADIIKKTNPPNPTNDPVYGKPTHCSLCKPPSNLESEDDVWFCKNNDCTNQNKLLTEG